MSLSSRVLSDLQSQRGRLLDEFQDWRRRTADGGDLTHHRSQVERTTARLEGLIEAVTQTTPLAPGANPATAALDSVMALRHDLGTVDLVWDFFRDKFAQRDMGYFADHLGAADDLAYAVYHPFQKAVEAAMLQGPHADDGGDSPTHAIPGTEMAPLGPEHFKTPPLLFYASDRSPFAQARASAFRPLGLSSRDIESIRQVLLRLPVPVIGLPWALSRSVPALVVVGHEAGHVVAEDLGLAGAFDGLIGGLGLGGDRGPVWQSWADECFADVFGVLVCGSAYVELLSRQLAKDLQGIRGERIDRNRPGAYPTAALRVSLCQAVQKSLGMAVDPSWRSTYGSVTGDAFSFAADVPEVARVLLDGPYPTLGGQGLKSVMTWSKDDDDLATEIGNVLLMGGQPSTPFDVRHWVAAAVRAQASDPQSYVDRRLDARLSAEIVAQRSDPFRGLEGFRDLSDAALRGPLGMPMGLESADPTGPSLTDRDRSMGNAMANLLSGVFSRASQDAPGPDDPGLVVSGPDPSPPQD